MAATRKKGKPRGKPFTPGVSGNPGGRPKSRPLSQSERLLKELNIVMERVKEQRRGKTLLEHFVNRAYDDDTVLTALIRKLLPDLKQVDSVMTMTGNITLEHLSDNQLDDRIREYVLKFGTDVETGKGRLPRSAKRKADTEMSA